MVIDQWIFEGTLNQYEPDAYSTVPLCICLFSIVGRGLICSLTPHYLTHEKFTPLHFTLYHLEAKYVLQCVFVGQLQVCLMKHINIYRVN